jgi:hypothetical protein
VQRLLSIAEIAQRLRPLVRERRATQELDELLRTLGFD